MWARGIPRDVPRGLPEDPAGNFEGLPVGLHVISCGPVLFPWDPAGTTGSTRGIPLDFPQVPVGVPWLLVGSHGNPMEISGGPTGNRTNMSTTAFLGGRGAMTARTPVIRYEPSRR